MTIDINNRSHVAAGRPDGGQYEKENGTTKTDTDLDPLLTVASLNMRNHALIDRTVMKTPEETQALLAETNRIEYGPEGATLYDKNGELLYHETNIAPRLDVKTMRQDPQVRAAVRRTFRDSLSTMSAKDKRTTIRMAVRHANSYDRRIAIDTSPNRRYLPATMIAGSLRRRKDQSKAVEVLKAIHYEDANASANIIRSGYPNNKNAAFKFINYTKIQRYDKDLVDKSTGKILHHKGDAINSTWTDREGKSHSGPLPNPKGAAARSYLRMLYQPTDGVPTKHETDRMCHVFSRMDDPTIQAKAFWNLCYGNQNPNDKWDDVNFEIGLIGQAHADREGAKLLNDWSKREGGQGNAARMIAYRKALSRDAMIRFLAMEPGDQRDARTMHTRRVRNKKTGVMENRKPKRLTEMRSFIHSVYEINDKEIADYKMTLSEPSEE